MKNDKRLGKDENMNEFSRPVATFESLNGVCRSKYGDAVKARKSPKIGLFFPPAAIHFLWDSFRRPSGRFSDISPSGAHEIQTKAGMEKLRITFD